MFSSISQLHFQEPLWLLALIPLALAIWLFTRSRPSASAWANVIDHNLLPFLLQGEESKASTWPKWLLGIGGLIAIIALADPVWEKISRPVFQTNTARVIVLDLSTSMLINDLKPSRLARARFKIEDILSRKEEGQTGLVVFAGDAFTASPLTRDVDTIRNLLQIFDPRIMPAQGSRVDYGLKKAHKLLKQAGAKNGQVLLIADGASNPNAAVKAAQALKADGHTVSVLAVGTEAGGLLRLRTKRVNVKLDTASLQKIAKKGGGGYHKITANNSDLNAVLIDAVSNDKENQTKSDDFKSDDWKSTGPYLLLMLLPIAALAFRKGWLLNLFIVIGLTSIVAQPQNIYADTNTDNSSLDANTKVNPTNNANNAAAEKNATELRDTIKQNWQKLWLNNEQLADKAIKQKQFQQASELSDSPLRKGSASYKNNDYKSALKAFKEGKGADARYNQGNALAKLEKYEEAIEAYKKALEQNPNMEDAKINKKAVEDFLKKKKKQQQKQNQKNNKNKKDQKNKDNKKSKDNKDNKDQKKGDKNKQQKDKKSGKDGNNKDDAQGEKQDKNGKQGKDKNQFAKANNALDKDKQEKDEPQDAQQQKAANDKNEQKKQDQTKNAEQKQAEAKKAQDKQKADDVKAAKAKAEELSKEEKMAAEQWLRRIPDDPGGLLRRKFRRQYQRSNRRPNDDEQPW